MFFFIKKKWYLKYPCCKKQVSKQVTEASLLSACDRQFQAENEQIDLGWFWPASKEQDLLS